MCGLIHSPRETPLVCLLEYLSIILLFKKAVTSLLRPQRSLSHFHNKYMTGRNSFL